MKNLLFKKKLTLQGAGGGGPKTPDYPPPQVTQYPSVLAPPQFKNIDTISSFSYAEMVDLISDGPIEGLINKNGKKVYDENIFEAIYLDDTPIKETSSEYTVEININFIKDFLITHWKQSTLNTTSPNKNILYANSIEDQNFNKDITFTSFHPASSIYEFVKSLNGSFDAIPLIQKSFDLSPIINEKPFLTIINIPSFKFFLPKDQFDPEEGGANSASPLKIGINDLSNYIYFSIGSETLNSFNYFELPRSYVNNNVSTLAGKKTFSKNKILDTSVYGFEGYDINIYIWSIYSEDTGIKQIDNILNKYFKKLYIFQNNSSLFNYNLVQSEFKNGAEIQAPLKYFSNIQIDFDYSKELVGPYCVTNDQKPAKADGFGGVQRITSYSESSPFVLPGLNIDIDSETSDDIRYVKYWPIDYDCKSSPFVLGNVVLNYTNFNKVSASRTSQEAVPITHYVTNDNTECAYVTISIDSLYDTNHVDLVSENISAFGQDGNGCSNIGKYYQTDRPGLGINTYENALGLKKDLTNSTASIIFLSYGKKDGTGEKRIINAIKYGYDISNTYGKVLDYTRGNFTQYPTAYNPTVFSSRDIQSFLRTLFDDLFRLQKSVAGTNFYKTISALSPIIPDIETLITPTINTNNVRWGALVTNKLFDYQIPKQYNYTLASFAFPTSRLSLEAKLKTLNSNNEAYYDYGLDEKEYLLDNNWTFEPLNDPNLKIEIDPDYSFFISRVNYRYPNFDAIGFDSNAIISTDIYKYIDFNYLIINNTANPDLSEIRYPNIYKYIINPKILNAPPSRIFLIGINGSYLKSQINFFKDASLTYLKEYILDQLIEDYYFDVSISASKTKVTNYNSTSKLQNIISKFKNGNLIGSTLVYSYTRVDYKDIEYFDPKNGDSYLKNLLNNPPASATNYNINNLNIFRDEYSSIDANDSVFYYDLFKNLDNALNYTSNNNGADITNWYGKWNRTEGTTTMIQIENEAQKNPTYQTAKQNITAGTKLPAIVVVDIESGYESKENNTFKNAGEFFSYRYNIYGMSSDPALVDLGRKSYDFVNACKRSSDQGGYLTKYRTYYLNNQDLYFIKVTRCNGSALINCFYLSDKINFYVGNMNLLSNVNIADLELSKYNISKLNFNSTQYGLCQIYDSTKSSSYNLDSNFEYIKNNLKYNLSADDVGKFLNQNYTNLDLGLSSTFLNSNILFTDALLLSLSADSFNKYGNPSCKYDQYTLFCNSTDYLDVCIFNYKYTYFQKITIEPTWIPRSDLGYIDYQGPGSENNKLSKTKDLKLIIYKNILNNSTYIGDQSNFLILEKTYPNDLILSFNSNENDNYNEFFIRFIAPDSRVIPDANNTYNKTIEQLNKELSTAINSYNSSKLSITNQAISETNIDDYIINTIIENNDYINSKLIKKNIISNLEYLSSSDLLNNLNKSKFKYSTKFTSSAQIKNINWTLNNNQIEVQNSDFISLKSIDKRLSLQASGLVNNIQIDAKFWIFYAKNTNISYLAFYLPSRDAGYSELKTIPDFPLSEVYSDAKEIVFQNEWYVDYVSDNNPNEILFNYITTQKISIRWFYSAPSGLRATIFYDTSNLNQQYNTYEGHLGRPHYLDVSGIQRLRTSQVNNTTIVPITNNIVRWEIYKKGWPGFRVWPWPPKSFDVWESYPSAFQYDPNARSNKLRFIPNSQPAVNSSFPKMTYYIGLDKVTNKLIYTNAFDEDIVFPNLDISFLPKFVGIRGNNIRTEWSVKTLTVAENVISPTAPSDRKKRILTEETSGKKYVLYAFCTSYASSLKIQDVEQILIDDGYIANDMRFISYQQPSYAICENSKMSLQAYSISTSNIYYNQKNTLSADIGTIIQLPKPLKDSNGNPIKRYIKITKKSHETLSTLVSKRIGVRKVTEIVPHKFSYPFSAIVGTKMDARAFAQIPNRTFHCKLKKILVPSNYFPNNENNEDVRYLNTNNLEKIYDGDWDGTFKLFWSNNPAWILMDLLINKRYGLGNYIESEQVDIWELYKIARWCDAVDDNGYYYGVPDAYGGVEPRHSFNALITEKFNIFDMINQVASIFRGHVYYMNSLITFSDDRLKPIIGEFNNSDVKDGLFTYSNHKKDDEFTAVDVAYVDEKDNYKPKIEYVEDSNGVRQRGILKKQINAFGITSKSQARRFGCHFLFQTSKENSIVNFTTDNRILLYRPGDLINIHDELFNSYKNFGIVKCFENLTDPTLFKIVIDKCLDPNIYNDKCITLHIPVAKPKYDDFYANAQYVPDDLCFTIESPILNAPEETGWIGDITSDNGTTYSNYILKNPNKTKFTFNMSTCDTTSTVKSFTGSVNKIYDIYVSNVNKGKKTCSIIGCLNYIENQNMNCEASKYGHWKFSTSLNSNNGNDIRFDIINNEELKYQLPYKNYFFQHFNSGKYLISDFLSEQSSEQFSMIDGSTNFTLNSPKNLVGTHCYSFNLSKYKDPKISFKNVIEYDRPSIDSFSIVGYTVGINNESCWTEITGSKLIRTEDDNSTYKDSTINNLCKLVTGSPYSLLLNNKNNKAFKITSIIENYINEYNVVAYEYNLDKFKEIEENSNIDDLRASFNFLGIEQASILEKANYNLLSPVITSLTQVVVNGKNHIRIQWNSVVNATEFNILIRTPSITTSNFAATVPISNFKTEINSFIYDWPIPENGDVGTYVFNIQSVNFNELQNMKKISPITSRSIVILNY